MSANPERTYCADTSALVWVQRNIGKVGPFADVWAALADLIAANRFFAPEIVQVEIERGTDDLSAWCRQHKLLFKAPTPEVANEVGRLGAQHPGFVNTLKPDDEADPWVVAWTVVEDRRLKNSLFPGECIAVATEGTRTNHIADVCRAEKVRCVTFQEMLDIEGLTFSRK